MPYVYRIRFFQTLCLAMLGGVCLQAAATPELAGHWELNKKGSDDSHERLEGLRVVRADPDGDTPRHPGESSSAFDMLDIAKERHQDHQETNIGELSGVLHTKAIVITREGNDFLLTYDDRFKRLLKPRPDGPRYSAKGDEFVANAIGHSMVYWQEESLIVETLLAPRGTMNEEFSLDGAHHQLRIHTILRNPDWLIDADIKRRFDFVR